MPQEARLWLTGIPVKPHDVDLAPAIRSGGRYGDLNNTQWVARIIAIYRSARTVRREPCHASGVSVRSTLLTRLRRGFSWILRRHRRPGASSPQHLPWKAGERLDGGHLSTIGVRSPWIWQVTSSHFQSSFVVTGQAPKWARRDRSFVAVTSFANTATSCPHLMQGPR